MVLLHQTSIWRRHPVCLYLAPAKDVLRRNLLPLMVAMVDSSIISDVGTTHVCYYMPFLITSTRIITVVRSFSPCSESTQSPVNGSATRSYTASASAVASRSPTWQRRRYSPTKCGYRRFPNARLCLGRYLSLLARTSSSEIWLLVLLASLVAESLLRQL
ncbi:uncharacterized protein BDW43DRAFT_181912 [Aspergillus alliaceus]|uniref:uncharacterized protein n=1 Tax=Petromyces alliaceus TaxID=209559 RepID=UPI0012A72CEF|nr:uncharacterized protein BDW43DRAFT_181912 [Aspergillus alliaceus]KAB8237712.1 hypothetical protein BDW43DRAFT_181912 [Aspergillus alliaceus]